jgi:hypothetical protein
MMSLGKRRERATLVDEYSALAAKASLTAAETARADSIQSEIKDLNDHIACLDLVEAQENEHCEYLRNEAFAKHDSSGVTG